MFIGNILLLKAYNEYKDNSDKMGFGSKLNSNYSKDSSVDKNSKVAIVKNNNALMVIDNGKIRMRFTTVKIEDLKSLKSPLYSLLVP